MDKSTAGARLHKEGSRAARASQTRRWRTEYQDVVSQWFEELPSGTEFIGEALRLAALERGLPHPTTPQAWSAMGGSMLRRWALSGALIFAGGVEKAVSPKAHARLYPLYRRR